MFTFMKDYGWYILGGVVIVAGVAVVVYNPTISKTIIEAGKALGSGAKKLAGTMKVPGGIVDRECFEELIGGGSTTEWQEAVLT